MRESARGGGGVKVRPLKETYELAAPAVRLSSTGSGDLTARGLHGQTQEITTTEAETLSLTGPDLPSRQTGPVDRLLRPTSCPHPHRSCAHWGLTRHT